MNYLFLIKGFWDKDIEFDFTDREIALYFYLLKVSNSIGWKNPFGLSNALTIAKFGWGKTSFDTARNSLKKAGLIDFRTGDGRKNVSQYEIKDLEKGIQKSTLSDTLSTTLSNTLSDTLSDAGAGNIIKHKHKLKQKPNTEPTGSPGLQPGDIVITSEKVDFKQAYSSLTKDSKCLGPFIRDIKPDFYEPYRDLWNLFADKWGLPKVKNFAEPRQKKFRTRINEPDFDFVGILRAAANAGDFLKTKKWFNWDWVFENQTNYVKVLEGNYEKEKVALITEPPPIVNREKIEYLQ